MTFFINQERDTKNSSSHKTGGDEIKSETLIHILKGWGKKEENKKTINYLLLSNSFEFTSSMDRKNVNQDLVSQVTEESRVLLRLVSRSGVRVARSVGQLTDLQSENTQLLKFVFHHICDSS